MKNYLFSILIIFFSTEIATGQDSKSNVGVEPKSIFELHINDKQYLLSEEELYKLDSLPTKASIYLKLTNFKTLDNIAFSFSYPRHLSFEFSQDFGYKNWTLSGNNISILLFEFDAKTPLNTLVDEMIKKFGRKNCSTETFKKGLGKKVLDGERLNLKLAGVKQFLDFYLIPSSDFKTRFICLQSTLGDDGNSNEEFVKGFKLIDSTFNYK